MVITICWWIQVQLGLFCYFLCSIAPILNEILFLSFSYIWICLPLYFILQWLGSWWNYISSSLIKYLFYRSVSDNTYQTYQLLRFHIHAFYIHWQTWIFSWCVFGVLLHILPFSMEQHLECTFNVAANKKTTANFRQAKTSLTGVCHLFWIS